MPKCHREKSPQSRSGVWRTTFSPVVFGKKGCRIAPISRNFQRVNAGLLCNPDCLAERVRFELTFEFLPC